jgi:hypothetical protein
MPMASLPHPRKLALFAALSLADLALTWFLLQRAAGRAYESNPVAAWWLSSFGRPGLVGFKLAGVGVVVGLVLLLSRHRPRAAGRVLAFGRSALSAVVLYSGCLVRDVAAERRELAATEAEGKRLETRLHDVSRCLDVKRRLAAEVIAGRLTLLEAAAHFHDLNRDWPASKWEQFRQHWPGRSDDERHCREVISYVRSELQNLRRADLGPVACLEDELREYLDRGELCLPESVTPAPAGEAEPPVLVGEKFVEPGNDWAGRGQGDEVIYSGGHGGR